MNADDLERALAQKRDAVAGLGDEEERLRQAQAIDELASYVSMLRDSTQTPSVRSRGVRRAFSFKLEFEDGRWDVHEQELEAEPRVGDIVSFADGRRWRVLASQIVRPRPARKSPHEFFVCAPVA